MARATVSEANEQLRAEVEQLKSENAQLRAQLANVNAELDRRDQRVEMAVMILRPPRTATVASEVDRPDRAIAATLPFPRNDGE